MIVVRRGRHKRSALFSDIDVWEHLFPGQKVDRISIDQMQPPPTRRQRNRMVDTKVSKGRRFIKEQNQARKREIRYQKELGVDPWDEPFERKIDPRANSRPPSYQRLLNAGVDPNSPPPPQSPGSQSTKKPLPKPSNSKALLAGLALAGAVGAVGAGAYFIRRRRSKKGKTIVERVRR